VQQQRCARGPACPAAAGTWDQLHDPCRVDRILSDHLVKVFSLHPLQYFGFGRVLASQGQIRQMAGGMLDSGIARGAQVLGFKVQLFGNAQFALKCFSRSSSQHGRGQHKPVHKAAPSLPCNAICKAY